MRADRPVAISAMLQRVSAGTISERIAEICGYREPAAGDRRRAAADERAGKAASRRPAAASRSSRSGCSRSGRRPPAALPARDRRQRRRGQRSGRRLRARPGGRDVRPTSTCRRAGTCCAGCCSGGPRRTCTRRRPPAGRRTGPRPDPLRERRRAADRRRLQPACRCGSTSAAARRFPVVSSPTRIWFWSIAVLLLPIGARMAGLEAAWLDYVQLVPTLVLIVACFALGEIALSPASPGANANASGVAAGARGGPPARRGPAREPRASTCCSAAAARRRCRGSARSSARTARSSTGRRRGSSPSSRSAAASRVSRSPGGLAVSLPLDPQLAELCAVVAIAHDERPGRLRRRADPRRPRAPQRSSPAPTAIRRSRSPAVSPARALPAGHHTPADTAGQRRSRRRRARRAVRGRRDPPARPRPRSRRGRD